MSADCGNIKTPSTHRRLGSATLSQLAFPGESNTNFAWEKFQWDNTVVKKIFLEDYSTFNLQSLVDVI